MVADLSTVARGRGGSTIHRTRTRPNVWLPRRRPCIWTPPRNAVALDNNLGNSNITSGSSFTLTTTAAASAGTLIVFFLSYFKGVTLTTVVSDPNGSYTMDKRVQNGSDWFEIWSRQATTGLASGSAISVTWGGSATGAILGGAASFTGVATSAALVTTSSATGTGANWSSGAATNAGQANALYVGGAGSEDVTAATSTPSSGVELHDDYNVSGQQGFVTGYKVVSVVASDSVAGTFTNSGSTKNTGALAIYAAAAVTVDNTTKPGLAGLFTPQLRQDGWF